MPKNRERKSANISLIFVLIGVIMISAPFLLQADMMNWGFASVVVGGFILFAAGISFLLFNKRAKVTSDILNETNLLARWTYDPEYWRREVAEEIESLSGIRIIGGIIGGILAIIGFIIMLTDPEDNAAFFLVMLAIGLIIFFIALASAAVQKKRLLNEPGEAVIVRDGVYYKGQLTDWNGVTSVLEGVCIDPRNPANLLFAYKYLSGSRARMPHMHPGTLQIPIPQGAEQSAYYIINYYNMPLSQERLDSLGRETDEETEEDAE
ncbi:MAG: hypothetical protein HGA22_10325 [Clostridiales bacterium]|nr:hypothetical protein [Clostridiales bacterium]